ncbi:DUF5753 domain-containing protein [Nocardia cyriacigeorgica]|uniref:DUF5753 domain-containing protein n=1 Tax=Nocardia cyriacigeorgica TaxID=135487 RepID=UPI001894DED6|nr:DUF5753 domain-containing protein [Nocardia cyriacigeorgica]MBF6439631.1 hypothetical protein [Nocardia cyriacigeorgica]
MTDTTIRHWSLDTIAARQHSIAEVECGNDIQRGYESDIIPGLLQTRAYASAVIATCLELGGHRDDDVEDAVAARVGRQVAWRASGGRGHFLSAEQTLYTGVGSREVTIEQLRALRELSAGTTLGIIPRAAPFLPVTAFTLYRDLVALETLTAAVFRTDATDLARYREVFDRLAEQSVTGEAATALIITAINAHHHEDTN